MAPACSPIAPYTPPGQVALHRLPVQLRALVRVMGEAAAYHLVQKRGGTSYMVPKAMRGQHFASLIELVASPSAAAALVAEMSGEALQLPKYDSVLRQLRHQRVLDMRRRGHRLADIALSTGYTVRTVINVCNAGGIGLGTDAPPQQGDLFGADQAEQHAVAA